MMLSEDVDDSGISGEGERFMMVELSEGSANERKQW
jgi:hypothetical protein